MLDDNAIFYAGKKKKQQKPFILVCTYIECDTIASVEYYNISFSVATQIVYGSFRRGNGGARWLTTLSAGNASPAVRNQTTRVDNNTTAYVITIIPSQ